MAQRSRESLVDNAPKSAAMVSIDVLGTRVKALREAKKLTQLQLAIDSQNDPSTISKLERGRAAITVGRLERIAKVLGTTVATLVQPE